MAGLSIIHLSDLHIGLRGDRADDWSDDRLADLTAHKLVEDLRRLSSQGEHPVPFSTTETLVVITGDITHHARWSEFATACRFLDVLQRRFSEEFRGEEILSTHIICIPGNHDLELPLYSAEHPNVEADRQTKYRTFELFLNRVAQHSGYASRYTMEDPVVLAEVASPLPLQIVGLDSCAHLRWYEDIPENGQAQAPRAGTAGWLSRAALEALARRLERSFRGLRIGLMHHRLGEIHQNPGEQDHCDMYHVQQWLRDHGFGVLLTGHAHEASQLDANPAEASTAHSFLRSGAPPKGSKPHDDFGYEVIRVEPQGVSFFPREFRGSWSRPFDEGTWEPLQGGASRRVRTLTRGPLPESVAESLGIGEQHSWVVVSHCDSGKFYPRRPPGETLDGLLSGQFDGSRPGLVRVEHRNQADWSRVPLVSAVFIVDAPGYNPYCREVLNRYQHYLTGGRIQFLPEGEGDDLVQRIQVGSRALYESDRTKKETFGTYDDYLVIMRLPRVVMPLAAQPQSHGPNSDGIVWVIAGIHSKATYAGAKMFDGSNLGQLLGAIASKCGGDVPQYFEALFRVPHDPETVEKADDLQCQYASPLRRKRDVAMMDEPPPGLAKGLLHDRAWTRVPIHTVHLDPVAGCNLNCSHCIEEEMREKRLLLSPSTYLEVLGDLWRLGCQHLHFYGGEPTLHPYFPELLRGATAMGLQMLLVTNGTLLGEAATRDALKEASAQLQVRVSLDAYDETSYCATHGSWATAETFGLVKANVEWLLAAGVGVTVSLLLSEGMIAGVKRACRHWRRKGATSVVLRPQTDAGGTSPRRLQDRELRQLESVLDEYRGFALAPPWLESWILTRDFPDSTKKYTTCYSAAYRMAISPGMPQGSVREWSLANQTFRETEEAWISLCTYRRYHEPTGLRYPRRQGNPQTGEPRSLADWAAGQRADQVRTMLNPSRDCGGIFCCRSAWNDVVQEGNSENGLGGTSR